MLPEIIFYLGSRTGSEAHAVVNSLMYYTFTFTEFLHASVRSWFGHIYITVLWVFTKQVSFGSAEGARTGLQTCFYHQGGLMPTG